jgi:uncharacterized protein
MSFTAKARLPRLGVGLSFRTEMAEAIYEHADELDFVEVILDNELNGSLHRDFGARIASRLPVVGHGVNSSVGSLEPLDTEYLLQIEQVARQMRCHWFSDHLAFTRSEQLDIGMLMPVQFSAGNVAFIAEKIRRISAALQRPFLIENIAYYFTIPGSAMQECDFILRVLESAQCGMLLDVNNLYANSLNHDFDPYAFIDRLPAEAIVEIHVAGGRKRGGLYLDTHGHAVSPEVMSLLDYALSTKRPNAVVLEREKNFPPIEELLGEIRELKCLWDRHFPEVRPAAMA